MTQAQRPTPETDALVDAAGRDRTPRKYVPQLLDHARALERQRDALAERVKEADDTLSLLLKYGSATRETLTRLVQRAELAESRLAALTEAAKRQGHDEPCYFCGKKCNELAGNPSEWPVPLTHSDDPGKVKWHHMGCVSRKLEAAKRLAQAVNACATHLETMARRNPALDAGVLAVAMDLRKAAEEIDRA